LPYQRPRSSADCARELFKGSNGLASLVDCTRKKFFGWEVRIFCEWRHKWSSFGVILAHVAWPRAQPLGQSVLLKFSLKTRLESESFESFDLAPDWRSIGSFFDFFNWLFFRISIGSCTDLNVDSGSGSNLKYWLWLLLQPKMQTPARVHSGSVIISDLYVARTNNNRVIMECDYCCLLPQCEALRTRRSGFLITTVHKVFEK